MSTSMRGKGVCYLIFLAATAGSAKEATTGYVQLGSGYVSDSDFKFGEYNGLEDKGGYQTLDFELVSPPEHGKSWSFSGQNIGLPIPTLALGLSDAGNLNFYGEYQKFSHNRSQGGHTVFTDTDSHYLTLPANWVAAETTAGLTGLSGPLLMVKETLERKRLRLSYEWLSAPDNWTFDAAYKHEVKKGSRVRYGVIGNTGGNPRAVALPTPVDFQFDELRVQASFQNKSYSASVGYHYSQFNNADKQQSWQNPFSTINGWEPEAGHPDGRGAIALEPDNRFHQLFFTGSARLTPQTRLQGSLDIGFMQQDEDFLPYTANPALDVTTPLPRNSLEGEIAITRATLGFYHRVNPRFALDISTRLEDRDNKTPTDLFIYIGGDSQNQPDAASSRARYNIPYDYRDTEIKTKLRYRAGKSTNVVGTYTYQDTKRDASEVRKLEQQSVGLAVSNRLGEQLQWRIEIEHERRDGSRYRGEKYFLESHTAAYIASLRPDERFENLPALRRYYIADRRRDKGSLRLDWLPNDLFQAGLTLTSVADDYPNTDFGLKNTQVRSAHLDTTYIMPDRFSWNIFAGYDQFDSRQTGRYFRGFALVSESQNPNRNWRHASNDGVKTLGAELHI